MEYVWLLAVGIMACALSFASGAALDAAVNRFCNRIQREAIATMESTIKTQNETYQKQQKTYEIQRGTIETQRETIELLQRR